jgi:hypothetical protein
MTKRIPVLLTFVVSGIITSGCGYTLVKNSALEPHRLSADSVQIVELQNQIATLKAQAKADSLRYTNLQAAATAAATATAAAAAASVVPDSVLRERDQEIATLKDQLTQLNAELDRIKRRLASPKA